MENPLGNHPAFQNDYDDMVGESGSKRTQEEIDQDIEFFVNHPLNVKVITPEMLERPEFQALAALAYDGTPDEVALNFLVSIYPSLSRNRITAMNV